LLLIPTSVKEIKDYVIKSEESFSEPIHAVVSGAGFSLKELDFELKQVELSSDRGWIRAEAGTASVTLEFDAITARLTRMRCKIDTKKGLRYFSSEEELFKRIHAAVSEKPNPAIQDICRSMTAAFIEADINSRAIAYFARGEEISIEDDQEHSGWGRVTLNSGGTAYIPKKNIEIKAKM